ncbi:unnamed protein product [Bursaphelenchus okinawaensis]|uniref:G-protein coupled receptors family 1 profile domain-containing protein n=1 Tax=Bursaphelenchus okinawaensis TaxID=465554 RepID=A0A811KKC5_9BILA|nr:unnamed protein product [Bursaphelenchus okinawaensis]CAG9105047.1 unnamed protein product [Bursaphelenchus okinawaensis]
MDQLSPTHLGLLYMALGVLGFACNATTAVMIISRRVFRLSAYTMMANVALADAMMTVVAGIVCGFVTATTPEQQTTSKLIEVDHNISTMTERTTRSFIPTPEHFIQMNLAGKTDTSSSHDMLEATLVFLEIASWIAGVVSYAYLGLNRCVAICFYGTKAKTFNRVTVAIIASISTWVAGIFAACMGTFTSSDSSSPLDMWSVSFTTMKRPPSTGFIVFVVSINIISVLLQWVCSTLVLMKIRQVKQKINKNKLNQNSANRFRKQARLTFQFFYPSLLCTISSTLYFAKPYMREVLSETHFVILHMIWLSNHLCNPFIYAYFNERMRLTYHEILSCARIRYYIKKQRKQRGFQRQNSRATMSRRSHGARSNRMSTRSAKSQRNGNFVRNSLQMQSRDFEQLCEFMMRVNPLYDSSEGWRESSDEDEKESVDRPMETRSEGLHVHRESRSIVLDLGRQTVEHWARFAKKASI